MSKKLQLILLENVRGYGNKGTIIEVAPAYAQNVLIPQGKAKIADSQTLNSIKQAEEKKKKDHEKALKSFYDMLENFEKKGGVVFKRQCTEMGHLYAKITEKDIANELLMIHQVKLPKDSIKLDQPIENLGEYVFKIEHEGIKKKLKLVVEKK